MYKKTVPEEKLDVKADSVCLRDKKITVISGNRKETNIIQKFNPHSDSIRALHVRRSSLKHDISGSICISFIIYPDGSVGEASIMQSTLDDNLLESQILEYISEKIKFSTDTSKEPTHVVYQTTFQQINVRSQRIATSIMLSVLSITLCIVSIVLLWKPK